MRNKILPLLMRNKILPLKIPNIFILIYYDPFFRVKCEAMRFSVSTRGHVTVKTLCKFGKVLVPKSALVEQSATVSWFSINFTHLYVIFVIFEWVCDSKTEISLHLCLYFSQFWLISNYKVTLLLDKRLFTKVMFLFFSI